MEIKCKVTFTLPKDIVEALDITDDSAVISYIEDGHVTVEIAANDDDSDFVDDEDDVDCIEDCDCCEYFCPHCGKCVIE